MPDNLNIQMTNQMAITATTTYRSHCPTVFGSVRFSIRFLYLRFHLELRLSLRPESEFLRDSDGQSVGHPLEAEVVGNACRPQRHRGPSKSVPARFPGASRRRPIRRAGIWAALFRTCEATWVRVLHCGRLSEALEGIVAKLKIGRYAAGHDVGEDQRNPNGRNYRSLPPRCFVAP